MPRFFTVVLPLVCLVIGLFNPKGLARPLLGVAAGIFLYDLHRLLASQPKHGRSTTLAAAVITAAVMIPVAYLVYQTPIWLEGHPSQSGAPESSRSESVARTPRIPESAPAPPAPTPKPVPARPRPKLYYNDRELNGATITLRPSNPDPRLCTAMHVWATAPTGVPDSFAVCGVWMKKPADAAGVSAFALYLDFSEEITQRHGDCRVSTEKPDPGYKVALVCQGWPTPSPTRWTLPAFFGLPVPAEGTKVRMRFEYGKSGRAEAAFALRPPTPAPGASPPPSAQAARPSGEATLPPGGSSNTVSNPQAVEELQRLRATAKRIDSWIERDQQLSTVVRLAIQKREYRAAIDITGDISSWITRDEMLGHIACYAVHRSGDRAAAEAAAALSSRISRDEVYKSIVTGATSKGESNDIPCAKL